MPNKTIYVREADLPLFEAAQADLGESISALFAEFLRERIKMMDTFVHVLHSTPLGSGQDQGFAVMFAPVGPTGTGAAMRPHYLPDGNQLVSFLQQVGFTHNAAARIESDLRTQSSVSVRETLPHSRCYRLFFNPVTIREEGGKQRLLKVDVTATPILGDHHWRANFHVLDDLMAGLENAFGLPTAQLATFRRNLLAGKPGSLGGHSGCELLLNQEQLLQLGMLRVDSRSVSYR